MVSIGATQVPFVVELPGVVEFVKPPGVVEFVKPDGPGKAELDVPDGSAELEFEGSDGEAKAELDVPEAPGEPGEPLVLEGP